MVLYAQLPEEAWTSKEAKVSYLKVFGCVSYVHMGSEARSKADSKFKTCTLIGYGIDEFGY